MLIGGLVGAVTMLLLAPQSGEDTRMQIQEKSIELRDRTTGMVEDAMAQVRLDRNRFTISGRQKAKELLNQGQALVVEKCPSEAYFGPKWGFQREIPQNRFKNGLT